MSLLRWIGEEDDAEESVLPPLPKVYRLNEPETSAEDPSADFSPFSAFVEEPDAYEPEGPDEEEDIPAAAPGALSRRYVPAAQELPQDGVTLCDIRPTRRGRMALFFQNAASEEEFLFSVDEETCVLQHLRPGTRLSAVELEAVRSQSDLRCAKDRALQYISMRDHASGELYRKLCEKFDEPTAAAAVAEMYRLGLVDADTVEKTEKQLMQALPPERWNEAHHYLIYHGRRVCHSRKPACENCTLQALCRAYQKGTPDMKPGK